MNAGPFGAVSHGGVFSGSASQLERTSAGAQPRATARGEPRDATRGGRRGRGGTAYFAAYRTADDDDADDVCKQKKQKMFIAATLPSGRRSGASTADGRDARDAVAVTSPARFLWRRRWSRPASGASPPARVGDAGGARRRGGYVEEEGSASIPSLPLVVNVDESSSSSSSSSKKSVSKKKKRAPSSYALYCAEARASLPALTEGARAGETARRTNG